MPGNEPFGQISRRGLFKVGAAAAAATGLSIDLVMDALDAGAGTQGNIAPQFAQPCVWNCRVDQATSGLTVDSTIQAAADTYKAAGALPFPEVLAKAGTGANQKGIPVDKVPIAGAHTSNITASDHLPDDMAVAWLTFPDGPPRTLSHHDNLDRVGGKRVFMRSSTPLQEQHTKDFHYLAWIAAAGASQLYEMCTFRKNPFFTGGRWEASKAVRWELDAPTAPSRLRPFRGAAWWAALPTTGGPPPITNDKDEFMSQSACASGFPMAPLMATQASLGKHALAIAVPGMYHQAGDEHIDWRPNTHHAPNGTNWPATYSDGYVSGPPLPMGTCWRLKFPPEDVWTVFLGRPASGPAYTAFLASNEYKFYLALHDYGAYDIMSGPEFHATLPMQPLNWTGNELRLTKDAGGALPNFFEFLEPVTVPIGPDPLTFGAWTGASTPDHAALRAAM